MNFVRINNLKNLLLKDIPTYHPESRKYLSYWREQKRRCIEGMWSVDDEEYHVEDLSTFDPYKCDYTGNKWRFITPNLYFYGNFGTILHSPKGAAKTSPKIRLRPSIRDVEWEVFYDVLEFRGFSGFELDEEYTCCEDLLDKDLLEDDYDISCFNSSGKLKTYVKPFDYLRGLKDKPLGKPLYRNGAKNYMLLATRELGKLLNINEVVRVKDGWSKIGDLNIGDKVYGLDGTLSNVIGKTDLQTDVEMYKITLRDGREIEACEDHLWYVWSHNRYRNHKESPYVVKSTKELLKDFKHLRKDSKHKEVYGVDRLCEEFIYALPNNKCITEDTNKELPLPAYLVGLLLGDGCLSKSSMISITSNDIEIVDYIKSTDYFSSATLKKGTNTFCILLKSTIKPILEELGLLDTYSNTKFIPRDYLFSSKEDRLELLKGLNDTDGYSGGIIEYCTTSERLNKDYQDLVRSLGMSCTSKKSKAGYRDKQGTYIKCLDRYRIALYTEENVFKLDRKLVGIKKKGKAAKSKQEKVFITNIEYVGKGSGVCIMVDNPTHTYITKDYIVTHNSFLVGGGIILHDLLVDGQKEYGGNIPVSEIFVGSALASKSFDLLKKVKLGMDNLPGTHGKGSKFETPSPLFKQMSGSIRPNNKWTHSYEKKVGGSWKTYGSGSNITHIPVTSENPEAAAGGRYSYVIIEEVGLCFSPETEVRMYDLSIKKIKDINVGDFVMGSSGNAEEVINTMSGKEEMFKISQTFGDDYTVSKNHIMYLNDRYKSNKLINPRKCLVQDVDNLCKSNRREIYGISNECLIFKKNNDILEVEPYFLGIWIGDGDCNSPSISAHDNSKELIDYIYEYSERLGMYVSKYETSYKCHRYGIIRQFGGNRIHKKDTVNNPNYLSQSLRNLGIFSNKRIPTKYQKASVKDRLDLLAGLLDTDGCIVTKKTEEHFEFYQTNRKDLVEDVRLLAKNLGFRTRVSIRRINTGYAGKILPEYRDKYVVRISGDINKIPVKIGYKKAPKREFKKHINSNSIKIESIGTGNYNGITLKNNPLFLLKDGTIVHNCPNIIQVHGSNTAAMQQGTHQMGSSVYIGTGGNVTKVVQSEEIFRHPSNYNMLEFEDEWENTGKICRFIPAYYKDNEFKDINGNTNVEKAIKHYEKRRERASNNSNTRALYAEMMNYPLKPSDMFLSEIGGIFPTADLKTIYGNVSTDKKTLDSHLRVELRIDALGKVFMETSKKPIIRDYPISVLKVDTDTAIEIYELPSKDSNDNIVSNRYSIGCLPKGEVVLTSKGLKKVEEVKLTDKLVNGEGNNVDIKLLLNHNVVNEDCYEIKMSNTYRTTTFTKEHPILISDKKLGYVSKDKYKRLGIKQRYYKFNFNFVKAEEIKKGQWIQFPNLYSNIKAIDLSKWKSTDNPLNKKDFWWFIGLWLGDGWTSINGRSIGVVFNSNEEYYINRYLDVITNVFNRTFSKRCRGNCVEIQFNFPQLVKFLDTNFNKKALNKNIPEWVKFIDVEFKKQMMLGYLASDGCVYKDTKGYYLTEFVSISLPLLEGFQDILTSLRIISSITKLRDAKQAKILGRVCNTKKTYHLRVSHNDSINLALLLGDKEDLKLSRIDFNNLPKVIKHPVIGCFISEDKKYIYYRIEDITKKSYTGVVYNYHCDTNIYTCRAITCHNCDPVDDDDKYRDSSLLSSIVMDTWTDRIVAEYTGKPPLVNNYYEQLRRLAMFYNAKILYEKNKKGLFTYLDNKNGIYLLEETPKFLGDIMDIKFSSIGNQKYGVTTGNKVIIKHCEDLVNDYLVQQAYDKPEGVLNMHTIKSPAILKELYMYNRDMNTDRVSAMFMVILARQSRLKFIDTSRNSTKRIMSSNDPFWNNAYNRNNKNMIKILH